MENIYEGDSEKPQDQNQDNSKKSDNKEQPTGYGAPQGDPTKIHIEKNPAELVTGLMDFLKSILSLRRANYDYKAVTEEARESVVFEGYNVWILICSIAVASVGLNVNSIPVVIGAMLISPLMGPIRGLGFGVGMNDLPLLYSSLKNFGVMVGVSLATSILYFAITPLDIVTSEILGRTEPSFLDAMIAFFGGLAGVISFSNSKKDTVVSGVAIATALMPPLCTAGYGIANAEWGYFFGASYLFLLNSLLIALSTVIFLRYVRFPKREYVSRKIERKVQNYIIIFVTLILLPSGYLFYKMTKKSIFESNVAEFVEKVVRPTESNLLVTFETDFEQEKPLIRLSVLNSYIDSTTAGLWNRQKPDYSLKDAEIKIIQGEDINAVADRKIKEALGLSGNQNELVNMLKEKELLISNMQNEYHNYKVNKEKHELDLDRILKRFRQEYEEVNFLAINKSFSYGPKNAVDTTFIISVNFKEDVSPEDQLKARKKLSKSFCFELYESCQIKLDSVSVINY